MRELDVPVALDYHNVTDAKFFWRWEPRAATTMLEGRRQLAIAAPAVRFAVADSEFNEGELIALGCERTAVAPILIDFTDYDTPPDATLLAERQRARGTRRLRLAVGRPRRAQQVPARRAPRVRGVPPDLRPAGAAHPGRRPERGPLLAGVAQARRGPRRRRRGHVHRRREPRAAARVLPHHRRVRAPLRARGIQRSRAGGDALRRARDRLRIVGGSRHRRRRGPAAHRQGPGRRGRRGRPPTLGRIVAPRSRRIGPEASRALLDRTHRAAHARLAHATHEGIIVIRSCRDV